MSNINSLLGKKALAPLRGTYAGLVTKYEAVDNSNGGYIRVTFKLVDREYQHVIFPTGNQVDYFVSAIAQQLEGNGTAAYGLTLGELLEELKTHPIKLYFSWSDVHNRLNCSFHAPAPTAAATVDFTAITGV